MLQITHVIGNIFADDRLSKFDLSIFEHLKMTRGELEKSRLRRETDSGTDVAISLEPGVRLHNGDVLEDNDKMILVEQMPEKVISVSFLDSNPELQVLVGHIIGNRHRPISIHDDVVSFPIQADSELEVFERLFSGVLDKIKLKVEELVFEPHTGADVHEH